jgi:class 3 adenylate cyclase
VTFLFTDIEGSTPLVSMLREAYGPVLAAHSAHPARDLPASREVSTEGDAFFAVFPSATDAIVPPPVPNAPRSAP